MLFYPVTVGAILFPAVGLWRRRDPIEALALGAAIGVLFWGTVGLARFFMLLPPGKAKTVGISTLVLAVGAGLALTWVARKQHLPQIALLPTPQLLGVVAGVAALTLGVEVTVPHYDTAGRFYDWFVHFDLARFYQTATGLGRTYANGTVTTRTALFNLMGSVALAALGTRFTVFQVFTAAVGWLWILPFTLLARRIVHDWTAPLVALAGLSPLIVHAHTYTWPKGLVAFLVLLALDRFLALQEAAPGEGRWIALQMAVLCGASIMTHPGFVGYPAALFALLGWQVLKRHRGWSELAVATAAAFLVALPWYAWAITQYGWHEALFSYPRAPYASIFRWAFDRFFILATSIFPVTLPFNPLAGTGDALEDCLIVYLGTAAGILGIAFLLRALAQNLAPATRIGAVPHAGTIMVFVAVGALTGAVLLDGLVGFNAASFGIPALLGLLLLTVSAKPPSRWAMRVAIVETTLLQLVLLLWVRSAASAGQNALLADLHGIRFLGQDIWPLGIALMLVGAAVSISTITAHISAVQTADVSERSRRIA